MPIFPVRKLRRSLPLLSVPPPYLLVFTTSHGCLVPAPIFFCPCHPQYPCYSHRHRHDHNNRDPRPSILHRRLLHINQIRPNNVADVVPDEEHASADGALGPALDVPRKESEQEDVRRAEGREEVVPEERQPTRVPGCAPEDERASEYGEASEGQEKGQRVSSFGLAR